MLEKEEEEFINSHLMVGVEKVLKLLKFLIMVMILGLELMINHGLLHIMDLKLLILYCQKSFKVTIKVEA
jgi:hypothetical protein